MATSLDDIRQWLVEGKQAGATHTIVVCDTYDHEDYPVHVAPGTDVREKYEEYATGKHSMQKVMEVYSHNLDHEAQLNEHRAFHFD